MFWLVLDQACLIRSIVSVHVHTCTLAAPFWPPRESPLPLVWSVAKLQWSNPLLRFDLDIKDGEKIFDLKGQGLWIKSPCKMIVKQRNHYADKLYLFADTAYSVLLQHVSPNISWMHQGYGRKSFISRISINLRTKIQYLLVEDKSTEERTFYWPCPDKISYTCTHNWIKNPGLFQQLYLTQSHSEEK